MGEAEESGGHAAAALTGARLPVALLAGTLLVVAAGTALRFWGLGTQSYWTDEMFSVQQGASGAAHAVGAGLVEVQPPFYAVLLSAWMGINPALATTLVWTRLLSALLGAGAVAVAWGSLRGSRISPEGRALAVATIAASGFAIVYSQETRPYSLLLLAATGLTGATVRWAVAAPTTGWRSVPWRSWLAWALLASAPHLFGLLLALGAAAVIVAVRRSWVDLRYAAVLVTLGALPQLAWIAVGRTRQGFAAGTNWIPAPGPDKILDLLTSTFASGSLVPEDGGFPWVSRLGLGAVVVLLLAAAVVGLVLSRRQGGSAPSRRGEPGHDEPGHEEPGHDEPGHDEPVVDAPTDGLAAVVLLALAGVVVVGVFLVSQVVHLWTLRNLIVVVPALSWGSSLLVLRLAGRARRWFAAAMLACLAGSLVAIASGLGAPYKTDVRGAVDYLTRVRAEQPDITFVWSGSGVPEAWFLATDSPVPAGTAQRVFSRTVYVSRPSYLQRVKAVPGPAVYVFYPDVAATEIDAQVAAVIARVGGPGVCHQVPIHGLVVVRCDP